MSKRGLRLVLAVKLAELPLRSVVRRGVRRINRDPSLCVFGADADRFGDNSAYVYVQLAQQSNLLRCVWITGSTALRDRLRAAGFEAEKRWSRRGILLCVRAGSYVVSSYASDVNRWFADGATLVNLWHGVPLKKIERDIDSGPLRLLFLDRQADEGRVLGSAATAGSTARAVGVHRRALLHERVCDPARTLPAVGVPANGSLLLGAARAAARTPRLRRPALARPTQAGARRRVLPDLARSSGGRGCRAVSTSTGSALRSTRLERISCTSRTSTPPHLLLFPGSPSSTPKTTPTHTFRSATCS